MGKLGQAKAGLIPNDVESMQPTMIFMSAACAACAMAIASVKPPALSSLMFTAS